MSYDQTFKGTFVFADAHCLEVGLDDFVTELDRSIVDLESLKVDGLRVTIDEDTSAPASMYFETTSAVRRLGSAAKSGSVKVSFTMDRTDRETVACGRRRDATGLPERHYRWDLFFAAKTGNAAKLRELAGRGIVLAQTFENYYGWSPLHLAARAGVGEALQVLLDAGIDPDIGWQSGTTPLALAANAEIARLLLGAGADKDRPVGNSVALAIAFERERIDVVEVLLDAGAAIPESGRKAMVESCARAGNLGALRRLAKLEPGIVEFFRDPDTMKSAIQGGESVLVDFLLDAGATLPESFLEDAIRSSSVALAEHALQTPDALQRCGLSSNPNDAMCIAASECSRPMIELLARVGVPLHPAESGGTSPLHMIARSSREAARECAAWLLDRGVPIDAIDPSGGTPLYRAADWGRSDMVLFLLERGANPASLERLETKKRAALRKALGEKWTTLVGETKKVAKKKAAKK